MTPGQGGVGGDGDGGGGGCFVEVGVDGEDAVDAAGVEDAGVFGDEVGAVAVVGGEEEVSLAHEDVGGAGEDLGVVALAEHGNQDADGEGVGAAEGAGDEVGAVAELAGGGADALASGFGDGAVGGVVEDEGDGRRREVEVLGEHLEADARAGRR